MTEDEGGRRRRAAEWNAQRNDEKRNGGACNKANEGKTTDEGWVNAVMCGRFWDRKIMNNSKGFVLMAYWLFFDVAIGIEAASFFLRFCVGLKKDIAESPAIAHLTEIVIDAQRTFSWQPKKHLCKVLSLNQAFRLGVLVMFIFLLQIFFPVIIIYRKGCVCLIEISFNLFNEVTLKS